MGLSSQQLTYLRSANQRFTAHTALFPAYTPTLTAPTPGAGTEIAHKPIVRCTPRYSVVDLEETIELYGRDSYIFPYVYVGDDNISFALDGGSSGSLLDNGDGTADYTAPAAGSGVAQINITCTNVNGEKVGQAFVAYPKNTYDDIVAEIASVNASVDKHGWTMLMRVKGDAADFTLGKGVLLHVEDTWAGTTSTFGGYKYAEGVFFGYITEAEYYQDWAGESWLGLEIKSPWWILENTKVGETYWGRTTGPDRYWADGFTPREAIWYYVNEFTDFSLYHDVIMFSDGNLIDDFLIDEADMATVVADVFARTLCVAYCDRYGALYCVPDPDIRAGEFWGSPLPTFDNDGDGGLDPTLVSEVNIKTFPQRVKKLRLEGVDANKLDIWGESENTGLGSVRSIHGLICQDPAILVTWAAMKRAQMNRAWEVSVSRFLDHTVDLLAFVDVNFTAPSQTNGLTASGRTWVHSITYRPDVVGGGWQGTWRLLKQTSGDIDGTSGWGGSGIWNPSNTASANSSGVNIGSGGWQTASAPVSAVTSFQVNAADGGPTLTLASGTLYEITLEGIVNFGGAQNLADANYYFKNPPTGWTAHPIRFDDNMQYPNWSLYPMDTATSASKYGYRFVATATALNVKFSDDPKVDNEGHFSGMLYEVV